MADPTETALHPQLTRRLLRQLSEGRSINLIGRPAQGSQRVLDDIHRAAPGGVTCLRTNCHDYRMSHHRLIDSLWQQAKANGCASSSRRVPDTLGELAAKLHGAQAVWLTLERLDTLIGEVERDDRYNCNFFRDELNALRNTPNIVLITQTARAHDQYSILCDTEDRMLSPPDLQKEPIPRLREPEIRTELARRKPGMDSGDTLTIAEAIERHIRIHAPLGFDSGYGLLEHIARQIELGGEVRGLRGWVREYEDILDCLNMGNINRARRGLKYRLRWLAISIVDLLKELSLLRKAVDTFRRLVKGRKGMP